jgi:hypothetical protein
MEIAMDGHPNNAARTPEQPPTLPHAARRNHPSTLDRLLDRLPWSRQTVLFGVAVSLFIHTALILWAALVVWSEPTAAASTGDGDVPLAVVAENDLEDGLLAGLATEVPQLQELEAPDLSAPAEDGPTTAETQTLEVTSTDDASGAGDVESIGGGGVFGAGGGAQFFGVEARGSRFAYVLDISGSMQGDRIKALRSALAASIAGLFDHAHFVIVPYADNATPLVGGQWVNATDRLKSRLLGEFNRIDPAGGTKPLGAFRAVFELTPRPDAVYFMTDGQFEAYEDDLLNLLQRANAGGGKRVPIHCITLIERGAEQTRRTIAQRSGGSYTHIEAAR